MKKSIIAGFVAVLAVFSSVLVLYLFVARTTSGHRQHEFSETVRFLGERVDSLERQRDLLAEAAASLEQESVGLRKRVQQIDAEIQNMRQILGSAKVSSRTALFSWKRFHLTTASGLVIIAFLAFIWMLYAASKRKDADAGPAEVADAAAAGDESPGPGSVLEEEFPAQAEESEEKLKTEETPEDPEAPATGEDAEAPAAEDEKKD
jgi:hypothetical protein